MSALTLIAALVTSLSISASPLPVQRCRELEGAFDYKGMIAACQTAAAEPDLTRSDRAEVYRLLGIAYAVVDDEENALRWFLKLLAFAPESRLPKDSSPKFREIFAKAQSAFARDGAIAVAHEPPTGVERDAPIPLSFTVTDKLQRVAFARVRAVLVEEGVENVPFDVALTRAPDASDRTKVVFRGVLPDPTRPRERPPLRYQLRYELVLIGEGGDALQATPPVKPVSLERESPEPPPDMGPLVWGIAGTTAAVVVGVGGAAAGVWCFTLGPCRGPQQNFASARIHVVIAPSEKP